jgi:hypothetical protein
MTATRSTTLLALLLLSAGCGGSGSSTPRSFRVGGTVAGLTGSGLVLHLGPASPGEDLPVAGSGTFQFATSLPEGSASAVSVKTQPTTPWQTCQVTAGATATTVVVTCATDAFQVGGTATGLLQGGLSVRNAGGPPLAVDALGAWVFPAAVPSGQPYLVTVDTNPPTQVCSVTGGIGTVAGAAVTDVALTCECAAGQANCNGTAPDGCEVTTATDQNNCGGCGTVCAVPNATPACTGGACVVGGCNPGFSDCDRNPANGCEISTVADLSNCGGCGNVCANPPRGTAACMASSCVLASCNAGYADCDRNVANGCEVATTTDTNNCGACGTVCPFPANGTMACVASACVIASCNPGFSDCDRNPSNGCEISTVSDVNNCGSCGTACTVGSSCVASACVAPASCKAIKQVAPAAPDGVYMIDPDGTGGAAAIPVFCDMTTDGGGWTFFAHVDGNSTVGNFFVSDVGTWDSSRADTGALYGRGGSVYQKLGATDLMVTLDSASATTAGAASKLVFYKFTAGDPAFSAGPIPCTGLGVGAGFTFRAGAGGTYQAGGANACSATAWFPTVAAGATQLTYFSAPSLGTYWGAGLASLATPGINTFGHDSWWYAR